MAIDFFVVCDDEQSATDLTDALSQGPGDQLSVGNKRSLDGSAGEWVVVGVATIRGLRIASDTLLNLVRIRRVKSLKIGDIEISNPSAAEVQQILKIALGNPAAADESLEIPSTD